jgi:hypothetical protein
MQFEDELIFKPGVYPGVDRLEDRRAQAIFENQINPKYFKTLEIATAIVETYRTVNDGILPESLDTAVPVMLDVIEMYTEAEGCITETEVGLIWRVAQRMFDDINHRHN